MRTISQRTKTAREKLGLSKSAFALRMLYDRNYIAAIEAGEREPGPRFVKQLEMIEREIVSASPREQVSSSVVSEHAESFDPRQRFENYIAASGLTEEEFSARLK